MRWGGTASGRTSLLPSLKHVAVRPDNEINRTPRPQEKVFQGGRRILRKIEIVQINVQYRKHGLDDLSPPNIFFQLITRLFPFYDRKQGQVKK
jgi:hypothetical protein